MTRNEKIRLALWITIVILIYGAACWVEPCDGHSCDREIVNPKPTEK